jgi:hypothetical protein
LNRFDKDRALTVLTYETRNRTNGSPWDDNLYSIRGLEEYVSSSQHTPAKTGPQMSDEVKSSRRATRKELIQTVINEQCRLRNSSAGREEVSLAARGLGTSEQELIAELLRGVSCSLSKMDKQRAIQFANKDEKEVGAKCNHSNQNRRRYLAMVKGKINDWANTSNKSVSSVGTERSTTGTTAPKSPGDASISYRIVGNHPNNYINNNNISPSKCPPPNTGEISDERPNDGEKDEKCDTTWTQQLISQPRNVMSQICETIGDLRIPK